MAMEMKGQVFLIGAVVIVVAMFFLKNMLDIYLTVEEERSLETSIIERQAENVHDQYRNYIYAASYQTNASAIYNLSNLSEFVRSDVDSEILYMIVFFNGTTRNYSVTAGNYLSDSVNITINASDSVPLSRPFGSVLDKTNVTQQFESHKNGTIEINLTYNRRNIITTERVSLFGSSKNSISAFVDTAVKDGETKARKRSELRRIW